MGSSLIISSVIVGLVQSYMGGIRIPEGYTMLQESQLVHDDTKIILDRAALVFDREKEAPNHISHLSSEVNDAMISFLSPLLPIAKFLKNSVLDFDKYVDSRDSIATGSIFEANYIKLFIVISRQLVAPEQVSSYL